MESVDHCLGILDLDHVSLQSIFACWLRNNASLSFMDKSVCQRVGTNNVLYINCTNRRYYFRMDKWLELERRSDWIRRQIDGYNGLDPFLNNAKYNIFRRFLHFYVWHSWILQSWPKFGWRSLHDCDFNVLYWIAFNWD